MESERTLKQSQLVVIGAGPGGYVAAFHGAENGMEVTLIDADPSLGGVCLNRGCIPSKALLHVARLINETRHSSRWGVTFGEPRIDLGKLRGWKSEVVGKLAGGVAELCRLRGVTVMNARASFLGSNRLRLTPANGEAEEVLGFEHAILATGSSPVVPGMFDIGDPRVMDSTAALDLEDVPGRLLVVGGGYIGLEMGTVYAALGSRVTCVEMTESLLPGLDRDLVRPLEKSLRSSFESIFLETRVESLEAEERGVLATLSGRGAPSELLFDRVLVAVGRRPNTEELGLENTDVKVDVRGFVEVDDRQRTADPSILAIGDVAGEPMLAHKASREAKVAIEVLGGEPTVFDNVAIPAVIFTDPEVAWCGLTETEARAEGREFEVARFPWGASSRALTLGRPEGLTKLIIEPQTQRVLGMGVVGVGAGELIAEGVLAVEMAAVARDVAESIHAHPTLSETVGESAESVIGAATHIYRPRRPEKKPAG